MNYDMNWGTLKPASTFGLQNTGAPGLKMPAAPMPSYMAMDGVGPMPGTDFSLGTAQVPGFSLPTYGANLAPTNLVGGGAGGGGGFGSVPFFNTRDQQGYGSFALQGASALANLYMGMKQYGLAKDQLSFQKDSFNKQYAANQSLTNSRLEDRQARRVLENPNATGVAEYMSKWGVK